MMWMQISNERFWKMNHAFCISPKRRFDENDDNDDNDDDSTAIDSGKIANVRWKETERKGEEKDR